METISRTEKLIIDDEKNLFELNENKNITNFENSIDFSNFKLNKFINIKI